MIYGTPHSSLAHVCLSSTRCLCFSSASLSQIANRPPQRKQATPSMSTPVLFIPTYGQPSKEQETSGRSKNSRELPSKCTAPSHASGSSKRSLMPSLVFNGNIEYVQVSILGSRSTLRFFAVISIYLDTFDGKILAFGYCLRSLLSANSRIREFSPTGFGIAHHSLPLHTYQVRM